MQNEFEKKIQQQLQQFSLEPDSAVWTNVAAQIRKEKKRRRLIFFWLSASVLLSVALGSYLYISSLADVRMAIVKDQGNNEKETLQIPADSNEENKIEKQKEEAVAATKDRQKDESKQKNSNNETTKNATENADVGKPASEPKRSNGRIVNRVSDQQNIDNRMTRSDAIEQYTSARKQNNLSERSTASRDVATQQLVQKNGVDSKHRKTVNGNYIIVSPGLKAEADVKQRSTNTPAVLSSNNGLAKNESSKTSDSSSATSEASIPVTKVEDQKRNDQLTAKKEDVRPATKPEDGNKNSNQIENTIKKVAASKAKRSIAFGFNVMAGVSDNVTSFPVFAEEKALRDAFSSASPTGAVSTAFITVSDHFNSRASVGIGAFLQMPLRKKLSLNIGVNFHQYNTAMQVGAKVDSGATVREATLHKTTIVSSFYKPGSSTTYKNKYHFIELPINVQWQLNKNNSRPFSFYAGVTPSILIGSKALLYNQSQTLYYRENLQYKKLQIFSQAGCMFAIANAKNYRYQLGPAFQYGLTNFTKSSIKTNEHLLFVGLIANVFFNKKTSPK
jgi:hypothetical protein